MICWTHVVTMLTAHIYFVGLTSAIHVGPTQVCSWVRHGTLMMASHRILICLNVGSTSSQRLNIFLSLFLFFELYFHYLISSFNCYIFHILHPLIKTMPSVLLRTTFTPTAQEMQLKGSNLKIFTTSELSCILI